MHLIEVKDISKVYEGKGASVTAIKTMDFHIDDGEFIGIMGQSGSGKSTLLSVLGGLNKPTSGTVLLDTLNVYSLSSEQRTDLRSEYIGIIFQSFQLVPYLTVEENVKLPMAVTGVKEKKQKEMADKVIKEVGLDHRKKMLPDQLSGGEQERVAIARAIVNNPPILLADEPTGNLDTKTSGEIMELLNSLNKAGQTIIMVTHNEKMTKYCSRVIKVKDGVCL